MCCLFFRIQNFYIKKVKVNKETLILEKNYILRLFLFRLFNLKKQTTHLVHSQYKSIAYNQCAVCFFILDFTTLNRAAHFLRHIVPLTVVNALTVVQHPANCIIIGQRHVRKPLLVVLACG